MLGASARKSKSCEASSRLINAALPSPTATLTTNRLGDHALSHRIQNQFGQVMQI
jgi:hypothetical protein